MGRVKEKALPAPGTLSTQMRPPCSSTRLLTMANPNPARRGDVIDTARQRESERPSHATGKGRLLNCHSLALTPTSECP